MYICKLLYDIQIVDMQHFYC